MEIEEKNNLKAENSQTEEGWDPANLAATIVLFIVGIGLLYWLFWALMVAKGVTTNIVAGIILLILVGEIIYLFRK